MSESVAIYSANRKLAMIDTAKMPLKLACYKHAKIKSGKKGKSSKGKDIPMKLDYFNIVKFPELLEEFGDKPKRIPIILPLDDINSFYTFHMAKWGMSKGKEKGVEMRRCNLTTCLHRGNYEIKGRKFSAGETTECICQSALLNKEVEDDAKKMCRADLQLKAFIFIPTKKRIDSPLAYIFESHSINSGINILSALTQLQEAMKPINGGRIAGMPMILSVNMVSREGDLSNTYPIWSLEPVATLTRMGEWSEAMEDENKLLKMDFSINEVQGGLELAEGTSEEESGETISIETPEDDRIFPFEEKKSEVEPKVIPADYHRLKKELTEMPDKVSKSTLIEWKKTNEIAITGLPDSLMAEIWNLLTEEIHEAYERER